MEHGIYRRPLWHAHGYPGERRQPGQAVRGGYTLTDRGEHPSEAESVHQRARISALILGLQPIVTSTLANPFVGEKVTRLQWVGLVLGLVGVSLVLHDRSIVLAGSVLAGLQASCR